MKEGQIELIKKAGRRKKNFILERKSKKNTLIAPNYPNYKKQTRIIRKFKRFKNKLPVPAAGDTDAPSNDTNEDNEKEILELRQKDEENAIYSSDSFQTTPYCLPEKNKY